MRRIGFAAVLVIAGLIVACSKSSTESPTETRPLGIGEQVGDAIMTPAGLLPRACVHIVPNGSSIDRNNLVTLPDGSKFQIHACTSPNRSQSGPQSTPIEADNVPGLGFDEKAESFESGPSYSSLTTGFRVPDLPSGNLIGWSLANKVYFAFPGLFNGTYIHQAVLFVGATHSGNVTSWNIAAWRCDNGGNNGQNCVASTFQHVNVGDSIGANVSAQSCNAGWCSWSISATDWTTDSSTGFVKSDTFTYRGARWAVESYNLSCSDYPMDGIWMRSIALKDHNGNSIAPSWSTDVLPKCNLYAVAQGGQGGTEAWVKLWHNVTTTLAGPTSPPTGVAANYSLSGMGADSHTYQWYRNDSVLSGQTGTSYSFTPLIPNTAVRISVRTVDVKTTWVDSLYMTSTPAFTAAISLPTNVNANGGDCNWNATVVGGKAPVTYSWKWDLTQVGTGTSLLYEWIAAAGDHHTLSFTATDANHYTASASKTVNMVASGGFTCPN